MITEKTTHLGHAIAYLLRPDMPPLSPDQRTDIANQLRRFRRLTETGPDYEEAYHEYALRTASQPQTLHPDTVKAIVDAALADYLTEEDS